MDLAKKANERLLYLDSARGFAALSVMIYHFIVAFELTSGLPNKAINPLHFFYYGQAGVLFFFIHSGFILSYSLTNREHKTRTSAYIRFIIERIFRIYPLFVFIVLISYILKQTLFPLGDVMYTTAHLQGYWKRDMNLDSLVNELVLIHSVDQEGTRRLIPQEWTAAVEIVIGLLIPLLLYFLRKIKWAWLYWLIILFVIKLLRFNTFLFDFALGVFLFYHMETIKKIWRRMPVQIKWLSAGAAILCFTCFFRFGSLFNPERVLIRPGVDHVIVSLGCSLLFCILISSARLQKLLSHTLLVHMGRICYSLYLVHMMILIFFGDYAVQLCHKFTGLPASICIILFFALYTASTFLISSITFRIIERPLNRFGKHVAKKTEKLVVSVESYLFQKIAPVRTNADKNDF